MSDFDGPMVATARPPSAAVNTKSQGAFDAVPSEQPQQPCRSGLGRISRFGRAFLHRRDPLPVGGINQRVEEQQQAHCNEREARDVGTTTDRGDKVAHDVRPSDRGQSHHCDYDGEDGEYGNADVEDLFQPDEQARVQWLAAAGDRIHGVEGFPDWAGIDISRAPVADQHGAERRNENDPEYAVRRQLGEIGNQLVKEQRRRPDQSEVDHAELQLGGAQDSGIPADQGVPPRKDQHAESKDRGGHRRIEAGRERARESERQTDRQCGRGDYGESRRKEAKPRVIAMPLRNELMDGHRSVMNERVVDKREQRRADARH